MLNIDALPGKPYLAQIQAIDPLIDVNGRSVGVRACIDNRQLQLRPGMFARVNTVFGVKEDARVIPEEAIVPQGGKQFVIKLLKGPSEQTRTTQRVEVKVGLRSPGKVEILEGLAPGDTVITTGQQRVPRDGTVVTVVSPAGNGTPGKKGGRPAAAAEAPAVQASAPEPVLARAPAVPAPLPGPNPCGAVVSDARPAAAPAPMRHAAPASLAPRDPA
jgi:membrane fusion protein (multidrug efflux system)